MKITDRSIYCVWRAASSIVFRASATSNATAPGTVGKWSTGVDQYTHEYPWREGKMGNNMNIDRNFLPVHFVFCRLAPPSPVDARTRCVLVGKSEQTSFAARTDRAGVGMERADGGWKKLPKSFHFPNGYIRKVGGVMVYKDGWCFFIDRPPGGLGPLSAFVVLALRTVALASPAAVAAGIPSSREAAECGGRRFCTGVALK